jgi:hypothetical protein
LIPAVVEASAADIEPHSTARQVVRRIAIHASSRKPSKPPGDIRNAVARYIHVFGCLAKRNAVTASDNRLVIKALTFNIAASLLVVIS